MTTSDERRKRAGSISHRRYRNLVQYKNLTDAEFDEAMDQMSQGLVRDAEFDRRIKKKIEDFGEDYDLDDLKVNDLLTLRGLAQAYIALEDYESYYYNLRKEGVSLDIMIEVEKLNNIISGLRKDISSMQADLNITRKVRKSDKEQNVITFLESLKEKAREFYQERMSYVYCPKCNNLLFTGWFHYPTERGNKLQLVCNRVLDNGETCGHKFQISIKDIMNDQDRGINISEVPEAMR